MKLNFLFILVFSTSFLINAQINNDLTTHYREFDQFMGIENSELNFGTIYNKRYRTFDKSFPFYKSNEFINGNVLYNNQFFQNQFKYDLFNDLLIVKYIDPENAFNLSLIPERIKNFTLGNDLFIKLDNHRDLKNFYGNGFFESVYMGDLYQLYIKHTKMHLSKIILNTVKNQFVEQSIYLLKYNERYFEINLKKNLINALPDKKEAINSAFKRDKDLTKESLMQFFSKIDKQEAK